MSQGIMERNLPVAESIQSGDKIRIVTSAGNSKQVDASQIGGGALKVTITSEEVGSDIVYSTDKTYNQIASAESVMFIIDSSDSDVPISYTIYPFMEYGYDAEYGYFAVCKSPVGDVYTFEAESADTILTFTTPR